MTHVGYLIAGWSIVLVSMLVYALYLVRRGRALSASVPADRQRWMTSETAAS